MSELGLNPCCGIVTSPYANSFVNLAAQSELDKALFFQSSSQYRFIKLNYKICWVALPSIKQKLLNTSAFIRNRDT